MLRAPDHPLTAFTLALALFATVAPAGASPEPGWIPLGPDAGQEVRSVTVQAGPQSGIYAAGVSGVFRTAGGSRWDLLNRGDLPLGETGVLYSTPGPDGALYLNTGGKSRFFAQPDDSGGKDPGHKIFKSVDGGETWRLARDATGELAVSPSDPSRLFLVTLTGIERSDDGGETWAPVASEPFQELRHLRIVRIIDVAMAPSDPDTVYTLLELTGDHGSPDEIRVLRSRDAGASWQELRGPDVFRVALSDLAVHPTDPETLYLVMSEGVFRSQDGGSTWESRSDDFPTRVEEMVIDPEQSRTLYAATRRFEESPGGVYRSTDAGLSWTPTSDGLPLPLTVHDLALDPTDPRTLYAATPRGVFRSSDGGDHWDPTSGELPSPVASVAPDPTAPATVFTGTDDGRLFVTNDGGQRWRRTGEGLPSRNAVRVLTIAPADPSVLFMHAGSGPLARSTDGGATWMPIGSPPSGGKFAGIVELLIDPRDSNRVLTATRGPGGVFVSPDLGSH